MASGFSNYQDQLTPTYYRVYIDMSGYDSTPGAFNGGGVEPFDHDSFAILNTDTDNSIRRARGNIRWNAVLMELQRFANCEILDVTATKTGPAFETAADDVAVSLAFTVGYAQEEYVFDSWQKFIGTDTLSDGSTQIDGTPWEQLSRSNQVANMGVIIKEAVTRGITIGGTSGYSRKYRTVIVAGTPTYYEQRDEVIKVKQPNTPANIWATITTASVIESMTQETIDTAADV